MIASSANGKIKRVINLIKKAKARKEAGLFVAEGLRMFKELPRGRIESLYVSDSFIKNPSNRGLVNSLPYESVADDVFKSMSDTAAPQGVLALVKQYEYTVNDILGAAGPALLLILDAIQDPGNLGTILRAGEGAGVTGVIMNDATVDIYNPKVIRSTMGSVCRVPFVCTRDLPAAISVIKKRGVRLYAAHLSGRDNYEEGDYTVSTGFLIGNEANGLCDALAAMADGYVKIPMLGKTESLNAAMAASVLAFEAARQRRIQRI